MTQLTLFTGRGNVSLAEALASALGAPLGGCFVENFPDDESHVRIDKDIRGHDVFLVQPTSPPVAVHFLELMLLADACRRAGAGRLTAVIPYFGYARQDRREAQGETVAARLFADMLQTRIDRLIAVDLHNPAIEGFFNVPVEHLSAVPLLADALRRSVSEDHIVVAPDLGAVRLAQRYGDFLNLPVVYIHKIRVSGRKTRVHRVIGEVQGRSPIVVDDMISTGGTMISTIQELLERGCAPQITLVATHGLFVEKALERFSGFPVKKIFVTDSVSLIKVPASPPIHVATLKDLLAEAVRGLHR